MEPDGGPTSAGADGPSADASSRVEERAAGSGWSSFAVLLGYGAISFVFFWRAGR